MSHSDPVLLPVIPQRVDSPNKFSIYANSTEVFVSGWDIRVNFMENVPPVGGQAIVEVHGSVVMSPVHTKAFGEALLKAVAQYEEKFGVLDAEKVMAFQTANAVPPKSE